MNWVLRRYGRAIIPLVVLLFIVKVVANSVGYDSKLLAQGCLLILIMAALVYDRRAKQEKADSD